MDKFHLVITGRRNTGKSSIVNTILQQDKAVVSPIAGTTTDPVKKSYEIPGVASVVLIDTAGTDDEGELGELRVKKTFETIRQADAALLVITGNRFGHFEEILTEEFQKLKLPFLIVHNKSDLEPLQEQLREKLLQKYGTPVIGFSTCQAKREMLIQKIGTLVNRQNSSSLLGDLGLSRPSGYAGHPHRFGSSDRPDDLASGTNVKRDIGPAWYRYCRPTRRNHDLFSAEFVTTGPGNHR